jgi:hypothetical protein
MSFHGQLLALFGSRPNVASEIVAQEPEGSFVRIADIRRQTTFRDLNVRI